MEILIPDKDHHELIIGTSGSGRSYFSEMLKEKCKANKGIYIDLNENPHFKGFNPIEYYYACSIVNSAKGKLPRGFQKKLHKRHIVITSKTNTDSVYKQKTSLQDETVIQTANIGLKRHLLSRARIALCDQSGIQLNEKQMIALLESSGLDEVLHSYDEVETTFREQVADALSRELIDKSWPTYNETNKGKGLYNSANKNDVPFVDELNKAAKAKGYQIAF